MRWWRESKDFKGNFWIDPGTKLSPHTVAAAIFRGEPKPSRPERVDLEAWLPDAEGLDSDVLVEEAIPMPRYNQVLSLIWLP